MIFANICVGNAVVITAFTRGKFTFVHGCSVGILTGVFCLGDFRRLTHIDAHQRRLYFGGGLPSQCVNKLARHEKMKTFTFFSTVANSILGA